MTGRGRAGPGRLDPCLGLGCHGEQVNVGRALGEGDIGIPRSPGQGEQASERRPLLGRGEPVVCRPQRRQPHARRVGLGRPCGQPGVLSQGRFGALPDDAAAHPGATGRQRPAHPHVRTPLGVRRAAHRDARRGGRRQRHDRHRARGRRHRGMGRIRGVCRGAGSHSEGAAQPHLDTPPLGGGEVEGGQVTDEAITSPAVALARAGCHRRRSVRSQRHHCGSDAGRHISGERHPEVAPEAPGRRGEAGAQPSRRRRAGGGHGEEQRDDLQRRRPPFGPVQRRLQGEGRRAGGAPGIPGRQVQRDEARGSGPGSVPV